MKNLVPWRGWIIGVLMLAGVACTGKSLRDRSDPPPRLLDLMVETWRGITGDDDAKDLTAGELAAAYARTGYEKTALELLQKVDSHRGLVQMARLATEFSHQGKKAAGWNFLSAAEAGSDRFLLSRPRDLCIRMTQAYAAYGKTEQADRWEANLSDADDVGVVKSLRQAEDLRLGRIALDKIEPRTEPELIEAIGAVLGAGKGTENQISGWLENAQARVGGMYPVDQVEAYLALADAARGLGRGEEAKGLLDKAAGLSLQVSPRMEAGTLGLISVADAYLRAGDRGKAGEWIEKARVSLPENPYMAQPKAYAKLAEVTWRMGDTKAAETLWTEALERARTHLHPRARRLGTFAVLESLLETKVPLTKDQEKMVLSVIEEQVQAAPLASNQVEGYLQEAGISPEAGLPEAKAQAAQAAAKDGQKAKDKKP